MRRKMIPARLTSETIHTVDSRVLVEVRQGSVLAHLMQAFATLVVVIRED